MLKAVIIDDTEKARIVLKSDLKQYCNNVSIIGEADSVITGLALLKEITPDIIFLDIRLEDGTGFDLLEKLPQQLKQKSKLIFTTAYNEFALKAFKFSAIDYLLKPIEAEDLISAVNKCEKKSNGNQYDLLIESFKNIENQNRRIALSSSDRIQIVAINEIVYCESQKNYTLFYLTEQRQILVTKTLKEYDDLLSNFEFVRVHHSYLINLKHLKEYVKIDGGYALMSNKQQIPVSVRKKEDLLKALGF